MATPNKRLAEALKLLQKLQERNVSGIHTNDIPNTKYRQLLLKNGFIKEVSKGWYISSNPQEKEGESTSWYAAFWDFCAGFLKHKYDQDWCLSAEQSLLWHAGNHAVPQQLMIRTSKGNNNPTPLPHNTSLFNYRGNVPSVAETSISDGLRMYNLPSALINSSATIYLHNPIEARTALALIRDASEVLGILLENGHTKKAGRLAGAFRNIGKEKIAAQIIETFKQADYDIREEDPFETKLELKFDARERSPYVFRIRLMWEQMREVIIPLFPAAPGIPDNHEEYLKQVEDIYVTDAYHSLSIERYRVTPELIAKVSSGTWNFEENEGDRKQRDAMAARGYYQAFQVVKESIKAILNGKNAGAQVDKDHGKWYLELFDPSVVAGILKTSDLAGYRNNQVYIGTSKHVPLNVDGMRDAMPVLFELLEKETEASVRAVLGHFIFVYIHPYSDGNGRMGRFLMNSMLASGGYPWTVVPLELRDDYMQALEKASTEQNIAPFAAYIAFLVRKTVEGNAIAHLPA